MSLNDKQMAALVRRIQKEANTLIEQKKRVKTPEAEVEETKSEIFDEMKKLPYSS